MGMGATLDDFRKGTMVIGTFAILVYTLFVYQPAYEAFTWPVLHAVRHYW